MITSSEIVQIVQKRQDELDQWLQKKSNKCSISKIKKAVKFYQQEYDDARFLSKKISESISSEQFLFVYTMMNEYMACFCHDLVCGLYISVLEKKLKKKQ